MAVRMSAAAATVEAVEAFGADDVVQEGQFVLVRMGTHLTVADATRGKEHKLGKRYTFRLDAIIGFPYGSVFEVQGLDLVPVPRARMTVASDAPAGEDNRLITGEDSQKMAQQEIMDLKSTDLDRATLIDKIAESNETFHSKTTYSQQKYLKRKAKKHLPVLAVERVNTRTIADWYFRKAPQKTQHIRFDVLALMLDRANVRAGANYLVVDTAQGLLAGAVLERLGGFGNLVLLHPGDLPQHQSLEYYNIPDAVRASYHTYPLSGISNIVAMRDKHARGEAVSYASQIDAIEADGAKRRLPDKDLTEDQVRRRNERDGRRAKRRAQTIAVEKLLIATKFDGLLVLSKYEPQLIVPRLLPLVRPSGTFAVHCQYTEPLVDCVETIRGDRALAMEIVETWLREYQVLPQRTHPHVMMNAAGGYILSGLTTATRTDETPPESSVDRTRKRRRRNESSPS